jgi:hypothetical protein
MDGQTGIFIHFSVMIPSIIVGVEEEKEVVVVVVVVVLSVLEDLN